MINSHVTAFTIEDGFVSGFRVPVTEELANAIAKKRITKGDTIYSSREAYTASQWDQKLGHISWAIQIRESMTGGETVLFDLLEKSETRLVPAGTFKLHWQDFIELLRTGDFEKAKRVEIEGPTPVNVKKPSSSASAQVYQLKTAPLSNDASPAPAINLKYRVGREIDELIGICRGIISDGIVVENEIAFLNGWLARNEEASRFWPAKPLTQRVRRILSDGIVTDEERADLTLFLEKVTADGHDQIARANQLLIQNATRSSLLPIDDPPPVIAFPEHRFCFTGKFLSGTRQWCEIETERRGGMPDDVNSCHFLVIGVLGSRDWAHSAFGRKIEAAMRRKGAKARWPKIVAEPHWLETINNTPRLPDRS